MICERPLTVNFSLQVMKSKQLFWFSFWDSTYVYHAIQEPRFTFLWWECRQYLMFESTCDWKPVIFVGCQDFSSGRVCEHEPAILISWLFSPLLLFRYWLNFMNQFNLFVTIIPWPFYRCKVQAIFFQYTKNTHFFVSPWKNRYCIAASRSTPPLVTCLIL